MIAKLQKVEKTAASEPLGLETPSREAPMIAECADLRVLQQHNPSIRRLRNRLLAANVIAWVAIIALIRLLFF
jgi:hypothetical protein